MNNDEINNFLSLITGVDVDKLPTREEVEAHEREAAKGSLFYREVADRNTWDRGCI